MTKTLFFLMLFAFTLMSLNSAAYELERVVENDSSSPVLHWPDSSLPIPYAVNEQASRDVSGDKLHASVRASFHTWEFASPSYAYFRYDGLSAVRKTERDAVNLVYWEETNWTDDRKAIAITTTWFTTDGIIREADIKANGVHFKWSNDPPQPCYPPSCSQTLMDVQNIMTHEIGHMLGLGDISDPGYSESTMFYDSRTAEIKKRSLEQDDLSGISRVYPGIPVYSVSPASGYNDESSLTVTINGSGFMDKAEVKLEKDWAPDISAQGVKVNSPYNISCVLNLRGAPVGKWRVIVANPAGKTGLLSDAFEIRKGSIGFQPVAVIPPQPEGLASGDDVLIDGSLSYDPNNDSLTYFWGLVKSPPGRSASLTNVTSSKAKLSSTSNGEYIVELKVGDGTSLSAPAQASITIGAGDSTKSENGDLAENMGCGCSHSPGGEFPAFEIFLLAVPSALFLFLLRRRTPPVR